MSHNDDVTLLLAQLPAAPLAALTTDLPACPSSVPEGRAFLHKALTAWDCAAGADDALLLLSETLTNAGPARRGAPSACICTAPPPTSPSRSATAARSCPRPRRAAEDEEVRPGGCSSSVRSPTAGGYGPRTRGRPPGSPSGCEGRSARSRGRAAPCPGRRRAATLVVRSPYHRARGTDPREVRVVLRPVVVGLDGSRESLTAAELGGAGGLCAALACRCAWCNAADSPTAGESELPELSAPRHWARRILRDAMDQINERYPQVYLSAEQIARPAAEALVNRGRRR